MVTPQGQAPERARQLISQVTDIPPPILDLDLIVELVETILEKFGQKP